MEEQEKQEKPKRIRKERKAQREEIPREAGNAPQSIYDSFDSFSSQPVLVGDQDKDAWIGNPTVKAGIVNPVDVLTKDLRMSFLDPELAFICHILHECSEEWRNHGMKRLATRRMVSLVGLLSLFASVDGKERMMQGKPSISFQGDLQEMKNMRRSMNPQDEEEKGFLGKRRN